MVTYIELFSGLAVLAFQNIDNDGKKTAIWDPLPLYDLKTTCAIIQGLVTYMEQFAGLAVSKFIKLIMVEGGWKED